MCVIHEQHYQLDAVRVSKREHGGGAPALHLIATPIRKTQHRAEAARFCTAPIKQLHMRVLVGKGARHCSGTEYALP